MAKMEEWTSASLILKSRDLKEFQILNSIFRNTP